MYHFISVDDDSVNRVITARSTEELFRKVKKYYLNKFSVDEDSGDIQEVVDLIRIREAQSWRDLGISVDYTNSWGQLGHRTDFPVEVTADEEVRELW